MSDILEIIKSRRTVKHFVPKFISWDKISRVIDAARHAPSSGNLQNWKFVVCWEPAQKEALAKAAYEEHEISMAGVLIVVCAEPEKVERYYGLRGERLYTVQNCAAAIQNMLLEAHSLGLGSCWIGAFDEDEVKTLLSIPAEARPQAIIAIGYSDEVAEKPPRYPLETLVYFSKWRSKSRDPAKYMNDVATILARKAESTQEMMKEAAGFVVDKAKEKAAETRGKKEAEKPSENL
ncbi:nitroreductase family protein [Candidatus Woesearchaeota archaeon]|nr:nitroreductase family protein [Candidatus Woesearchaeota archaeon]